jgi:hypothetical protein
MLPAIEVRGGVADQKEERKSRSMLNRSTE